MKAKIKFKKYNSDIMNVVRCFILVFLVMLCKTGSNNDPVVVTHIEPVTITDEIMTDFPGSLHLQDSFLIWSDPFNYSAFIKIVDINSGKQVAQTGEIGQGPKEFVTPIVHDLDIDKIGVTDLNSNKRAVFQLEKLLAGDEPFYYFKKNGLKESTRYLEIEEDVFVGLFPEETNLFKIIKNSKAISFGRFPIDEFLSADDKFNYLQGNIVYNSKEKKLIYSPSSFPYIITYKRVGESFEHEKTLKIFDVKYRMVNGELKFNERITLIDEISATKDYFVAARHKEFKNDIDITTGWTKRPQTLYLYDYDLNLKKIVDVGIPIVRITGNENSNTVYAIVINPEYSIVKIELP
jgi:hypothetical protein